MPLNITTTIDILRAIQTASEEANNPKPIEPPRLFLPSALAKSLVSDLGVLPENVVIVGKLPT